VSARSLDDISHRIDTDPWAYRTAYAQRDIEDPQGLYGHSHIDIHVEVARGVQHARENSSVEQSVSHATPHAGEVPNHRMESEG
jgi:hypothetical protein